MKSVKLLVWVLLLTETRPVHADAPPLIPLQGYLTDRSDQPLEGQHQFHLRIYAALTGGAALFDETRTVTVNGGQFSAYLGDSKALDLSLFQRNSSLFVGIGVDADEELTPRIQLGTAPFAGYAQYCGEAAGLAGVPTTDLVRNGHQHSASEITSGTLDPARYDAYANLSTQGHLDGRSPAALLTRAGADALYGSGGSTSGAKGSTDGFFEPIDSSKQVNLTPNQPVRVAGGSIQTSGPGLVLVIGTAQVAGNSSSSSPVFWLDIVKAGEDPTKSDASYLATPSGLAQSFTVHGIYPVTASGTQVFDLNVRAVEGGYSRAAHLSLLFIPSSSSP